jgi:hypothetical protein
MPVLPPCIRQISGGTRQDRASDRLGQRQSLYLLAQALELDGRAANRYSSCSNPIADGPTVQPTRYPERQKHRLLVHGEFAEIAFRSAPSLVSA